MLITNDWLLKWQTVKGGYNKRQLELVGIVWPPKRGWKRDLIGADISDETARSFELRSGRQNDSQPDAQV